MLGLSKSLWPQNKGMGALNKAQGNVGVQGPCLCGEILNTTKNLVCKWCVPSDRCCSSCGDQEWCTGGEQILTTAEGLWWGRQQGYPGTRLVCFSRQTKRCSSRVVWEINCWVVFAALESVLPSQGEKLQGPPATFCLSLQLWLNPAWLKNILMDKRCKSPYLKWICQEESDFNYVFEV